ncbi:Putative FluG domain-containing protein [[Torrubiella] hemipterigena]|uniref:Putative FluG domain-containing protein n=1 Tax=[Torrubiella] hemipterigena TaxID=1531966 RepID=A0A0A1TMH0_9HYPO|nr:Putative FluG domain-containing protein [[Torrubiella] hemipterigena]
MHGVKQKWIVHCTHLTVNPHAHLKQSTKEDIMTFLEWMLDSYRRIRKRSTVHAYKRILFQVYRKSIGIDFDKNENDEVNNFINGYLTIRYKLDTSVNEKPVMDVDDVYLVQHHHWVHDTSIFPDERQRIQLAFLILLQAYTATRPRVFAYKKLSKKAIHDHYFGSEDEDIMNEAEEWDSNEDDFKTICYKDVRLILLKNPDGGRDLPALEVTLRYTKGWERRENPKTFIFYEVDDLLFDAVLHILALALLDRAFKSKIRTVHDFYKIKVPPPRHSLEFEWRVEILNVPIFRQAMLTSDGTIRTSDHEALRYHTYLYYLQRLGLVTGLMQILNPYCIRRGAGEGVEAVGTQAQLQQVMHHINAATYQAYINQRVQCDTVAAFLGRPSNKALIKAAGHMSRYADPRAPTSASTVELGKIKTNTTLIKMIELRDTLSLEVRRESGSIKNGEACGTKLSQMYRAIENKVRSTRSYLRKLAKSSTREDFFNKVNTAEINAQLQDEEQTFLDLKSDSWKPQSDYNLEERRLLARLICASITELDDETKLRHRLYTTHTMVILGQKKEPRPAQPAVKQDLQTIPEKCDKNQCFICFWDSTASPSQRFYKYCSPYRARDHLYSRHLKGIEEHSIACPDPKCRDTKAIFKERHAFQSHLAKVHDYDNFNRYKCLETCI